MWEVVKDGEYRRFLVKAQEAKRGGRETWVVMSTGEKVCVALALNRPDWLADFSNGFQDSYTLAQAIERAGNWLQYVPAVERELRDEDMD